MLGLVGGMEWTEDPRDMIAGRGGMGGAGAEGGVAWMREMLDFVRR